MDSLEQPMHNLASRFMLVFGILICVLGCQPSGSEKSAANAPVKVRTVAAVQKEITKKTRQPASILPFYETEIRSKVNGYVSEVNADIGDFVLKDQVLAKLDIPELEKQVAIAKSNVQLLEARQMEAQAGVVLAQASVDATKAKLEQARSEMLEKDAILAAAQAELDRTQDLVNRGSLQARLLDEVQKKFDSAKAGQAAIISSVQSAEAEVVVAQAHLTAAEANTEGARAETDVAKRQLEEMVVMQEYAELKAPFAGLITKRHVNLGELIDGSLQSGSHALFVISQTDQVRVQIPVPEVDAPFVQVGDKLTLMFPAFSAEPPVEANVTRQNGSLDPNTRTLLVEAVLDNADGKFLPGMFGEAEIDMETQVATTMLPARCIRFNESGQAFVYLVQSDNQIKVTAVRTGLDTGTEIEVIDGIQPNQIVVGPHLNRFTDGQKVEPL